MKTLYIFLLFFLPQYLPAQQVLYSFDKQKILIGEPIKMTVQAKAGAKDMNDIFTIDTLPHFEIIDRSKIDTTGTGGSLLLSQILTITSWDSGRWVLPSVMLNHVPAKPFTIDVGYSSPFDPKQPYHDIKGIVPVKNPGKNSWWWYIIGLAVLVALFLLFFPSGKKEAATVVLDSGAYKKALQQLDALQKENGASGNVKQYYTELISIFRTYLKNGKGIHSFSKTSDDLGLQLKAANMPGDEHNHLLLTLRLSDLVKFAQYQPDDNINTEALNTIKQSITTIEQGYVV